MIEQLGTVCELMSACNNDVTGMCCVRALFWVPHADIPFGVLAAVGFFSDSNVTRRNWWCFHACFGACHVFEVPSPLARTWFSTLQQHRELHLQCMCMKVMTHRCSSSRNLAVKILPLGIKSRNYCVNGSHVCLCTSPASWLGDIYSDQFPANDM